MFRLCGGGGGGGEGGGGGGRKGAHIHSHPISQLIAPQLQTKNSSMLALGSA